MKRPYECKVSGCDKSYTTRFSLRRHIASHSAIKQHVCVLCFKTFTLAQYLKEHTYIHTQQKPFKCDFAGCTRAFRQAGKLSMHRKVHQNIIFSIQRVKRRPAGEPVQQEDGAPPIVVVEKENNIVQNTTTTMINTMQMGTSQAQEEAKDEQENGSDSNLNRVTIPHRQDDLYMIGEETEHELSLSREDDSDLSEPSSHHEEAVEEEKRNSNEDNQAEQKQVEECDDDDSQSLESSFMEESVFDENYLRREEHAKVANLLERRDKENMISQTGHKTKAPFELLIKKLVDSLHQPKITAEKSLPVPIEGFLPAKNIPKKDLSQMKPVAGADVTSQKQTTMAEKTQGAAFTEIYKKLATYATNSDIVPQLKSADSAKDKQDDLIEICTKEAMAQEAQPNIDELAKPKNFDSKSVQQNVIKDANLTSAFKSPESCEVIEIAQPIAQPRPDIINPFMAAEVPMVMPVPQNPGMMQMAVPAMPMMPQQLMQMAPNNMMMAPQPGQFQPQQQICYQQMPQFPMQAGPMHPGPQTISFVQLVPMHVQMQPLQGVPMHSMMMQMPQPFM